MKLTTLSVLMSVAVFGLAGCASKGSGSETRSATKAVWNPPAPTTPTNKTSDFNFTVSVTDSKAMNMTYIPRPSAEFLKQAQRAFDKTNQIRREKGLPPVKYDDNVAALAQMRAGELATAHNFNHVRHNGEMDYGYLLGSKEWLMGNLAAGVSTGEEAIQMWVKSPKHYEVMLMKNLETLGVGLAYNPDSQWKYYWVLMFGYKGAKPAIAFSDVLPTNPKPLEQLIVNGSTIPLPKVQSGSWQAINANGHTGWVNGYQHSRFGSVGKNNAQTHLFYQGARTDDTKMPKSGQATYNGHALIIKNGTVNTNAQSRFTADFGTRKLNGTIHQNNSTLYTLSADINGGAFASKAGASVETQGAFFGENADELGGVFKDNKTDTKGVFGAKK